ncbi:lysylphosphatidylglycerol synthase transmembrane domain-containing protein [Clostridium sp. 1001271B_151109_B4]|uniref:lysylphosphatidylglycerol synthase transmembrane domain-containing protein n=1 Tax=Clostridium sp. 1001271B_151109_B4 TaxID=2787148 RepID=UPI0018ABEC09|nr:lysylphosphatidylglycerol synthase transmembrane domain-containing protein [Clostridium sp. 1001271B_151109_B4]
MNSMSLKKILKSSLLFIALIGVTFFIVFKDNSFNNIVETLKSVNLTYIYVGILFMFFFICCEAINIRRMLRLLSYDISIVKGLKYAFVGFFFSSITPSASGGQPMQIYYMKKDNVDISHSSLVLLVELASFQFVTIVVALLSFMGNYKFIITLNPAIKILIGIGIIFNTMVFLFIGLAIFSKKFISKIIELIFKLVSRIRFINSNKLRNIVDEEINQYQEGAIFIKENKMVIVKVVLTTFAQIFFNYSITFFVYKALNLSTYSFMSVFSLQSILFISVSALPLPGAVGSSESSFLTLFKTLFPASTLSSAMLLSRGISFYLFVIISGVIVLFIGLFKKNLKEKYLNNKRVADKIAIGK